MLWIIVNYSFFVCLGMKCIVIKFIYKISDLEVVILLMILLYIDGKEVVIVVINYLKEN